jgi:PAS domain S-box-containing protein
VTEAARHLDRFLRWLTVLAFAFAAPELYADVAFHAPRMWVPTAAGTFLAASCIVGAALARRQRIREAVGVVTGTLIVSGGVLAVALPELRILPVAIGTLTVLIALPYLDVRSLAALSIATLAWTVLVTALREAIGVPSGLPRWFLVGFRVSATAVSAALILFLILRARTILAHLLETSREAETRYRTLVDQLPAVTFIDRITGPGRDDVTPVYISPQVEGIFGYPTEAWLSEADLWTRRLHPDDRDRVIAMAAEAERRGAFSAEYRMLARDGAVVWIQEESVRIDERDGTPRYWQGVMLDVTARNEAERELRRSLGLLRRTDDQRRRLMTELVSAQEAERKRIAAEIHDDPVQKMTAVLLRLQLLERTLGDERDLEIVRQVGTTVEQTIARMRALMFELRPTSLDRGGLADAIRDFVEREPDLPACEIVDHLASEPNDERRTIAYRIATEALRNVERHALASAAQVLLEEREGGLFLRVADDGVGMSPEVARSGRAGHLGLTSLRELAEMSGGWTRIESRPGGGTSISTWLPMAWAGRSAAASEATTEAPSRVAQPDRLA